MNEESDPAAPLAFLGRTAEGDLLRFRRDVPPEVRARVSGAAAKLASWRPGEPSSGLEAVASALERADVRSGPAFVAGPTFMPPVGAVQIYPGNAGLLHPDLASWGPELHWRRPAFVVMREGLAVSICASARLTPESAEAGVETAPAYRGQGCALLAVNAWIREVRASGRVAFYSTQWPNTASRAIAARLELQPFAEDNSFG